MGWQDDLIPQDATVDVDGAPKPFREIPFVKEAPDVITALRRGYDAHREAGARVPVRIERVRNADGTFGPKAEAVATWRKEHLPKLYEAGIIDAPPLNVEAYDIKRPNDIPEGVAWSDERAKKFGELGLKHGVSKSAMSDFLALHREAVIGTQEVLKTSYDEGMAALKKEHGEDLEAVLEDCKRLNDIIFQKPEELELIEKTGIANHPTWLSILARLSKFAKQDSSLVEDMTSSGTRNTGEANVATQEALRREIADIMTNPQNTLYEKYHRGDAQVRADIEKKYEEAYGVKGMRELTPALSMGAR